jgi:hypothetical protein
MGNIGSYVMWTLPRYEPEHQVTVATVLELGTACSLQA